MFGLTEAEKVFALLLGLASSPQDISAFPGFSDGGHSGADNRLAASDMRPQSGHRAVPCVAKLSAKSRPLPIAMRMTALRPHFGHPPSDLDITKAAVR
jgi:hypothetical protein